jgi:cardiolipin synthase
MNHAPTVDYYIRRGVIYHALGFFHFQWSEMMSHVSDDIGAVPLSVAAYPVRHGNWVRCWAGEIAFFARLHEAMRAATSQFFVAVSFINKAFRLPDGTLWWDALDEMQRRGVDVRLLFWRNPKFFSLHNIFQGSREDREWLAARDARWAARWDSSGDDAAHCHHQKTWLIDPDSPHGIAFVGGMVMTKTNLAEVARAGIRHERHDVTLEMRGPVVDDVFCNFVQRWNAPHADANAPQPWPDSVCANDLSDSTPQKLHQGKSRVQILRTIRPHLYGIVEGEQSIFEGYKRAFEAAQHTIYIENQHPGELLLLCALEDALRRGVRVLMVVPGEPMGSICREKRRADEVEKARTQGIQVEDTRYSPVFRVLSGLGRYPHFVLASLVDSAQQPHREIYTHAKVCVVDEAWVTCGSANFVDISLQRDHTEINAAVWDSDFAAAILRDLLSLHMHAPPDSTQPHTVWMIAAQTEAQQNAKRRAEHLPLHGTLCAIDPAVYGQAA